MARETHEGSICLEFRVMVRLNVAASQLDVCVNKGMFALRGRPGIQPGEVLLLQLNKSDWQAEGGKDGRIRHALVFKYAGPDPRGEISQSHWPMAGRTWSWILYSSAVLRTKPFSLEALPLARKSHYQAQSNAVHIDPEDESIILPYLDWSSTFPIVQDLGRADANAPIATTSDRDIVESFSVEHAIAAVEARYAGARVIPMRRNNPGFDLIVTERGRVVRYIEVKGTRSGRPAFRLTETERLFSAENSALYTLIVIWNIDLARETYQITSQDGEVLVGDILRPESYSGQLPIKSV